MPRLKPSIETERGYAATSWQIFGTTGSVWDASEQSPELMWPWSIAVYDRMRRTDAQVGSTNRALLLAMLGKTFAVDPNGADPKIVQHVAEDLNLPILGQEPTPPGRSRGRFSFRKHLRMAALALSYGHMPFEQVYRIEGSGTGQLARLHKLAPRMPATLADIKVAKDGGLDGIVQYGDGIKGVTIDVERLVYYAHELEGAAWAGNSTLRSCYKDWLHKDRLIRVDTITGERAGMGIVEVEMPPNVTDPKERDLYLQLGQELRAGERAAVAMPNGGHVRIRGVEGTLPDLIAKVRYHDEQIARNHMQMVFMLGTTSAGSRALGDTLLNAFDMSVDAATDELVDTFNEHAVEDLVDLNYGEGERAPRVVHTPAESSRDLDAESLKHLVESGVIQPDDDLEAQQRVKYRLTKKDPGSARVPELRPGGTALVAAARARQARARSVRATDPKEPASATDLPEPFGTIYQRRLDLEAASNVLLGDALQLLADTVDLEPVTALVGTVKADSTQPIEPDPRIVEAEALAAAALTEAAASTELREVAHDALVQSYAEGAAGAGQLVSVTTGQVGIDLESLLVAFEDAVAAALNLDELWDAADTWIADHVGVVSRAMGDAVADALEHGITRAELLKDLRAIVEDTKAAAVLYDHALATALDQGAVDLYASEGISELEVLTAGDARVDDICRDLETDGPYPVTEPPSLPAHIGCRCAVIPSDDSLRSLLGGAK